MPIAPHTLPVGHGKLDASSHTPASSQLTPGWHVLALVVVSPRQNCLWARHARRSPVTWSQSGPAQAH
jgi:hypothetical protein